jgi:DNA segregation ATPase FtsK/SpoIIIE, S-DNA-T family
MPLNLSLASRRLNQLTQGLFNTEAPNKKWKLPNLDLLEDISSTDLELTASFTPPIEPKQLENILETYGISVDVVDYFIGPSVTTFELKLPTGFKLTSIIKAEGDLARYLKSPTLRIIKTLKDSSNIGLELSNNKRFSVNYKSLIQSLPQSMTLPVIMGEDTRGNPIYTDLVDMPHLLVAGTTGSGKSVFLNSIILTLLASKKPADVKMILVDPKQIEFCDYEDVPHLLKPIAYSIEGAIELLYEVVDIMEERFEILHEAGAKKLSEYNELSKRYLPYIVFIVDEYADLILMGTSKEKKEVERNMARIAQKARAVGIHMIAATQKPIREVVTPLLKANLPARVAFRVASGSDSRIILDCKGAEALTGKGDMLFKDPTAKTEFESLRRIQAPFVSKSDTDIILNQ